MTDRASLLEARCAKCGGKDILLRWHTGGRYGTGGCGMFAKVVEYDEHLHLTCRTCQFEWAAATRDAAPEAPAGHPVDCECGQYKECLA